MSSGTNPANPITLAQRLHILLLYCLPHHVVSRGMYFLTRRRVPGVAAVIRWFVRRYRVELGDAESPEPAAYPTFNAFFTRALKPGARPIAELADGLVCPVDGTVSAIGQLTAGRVLQAKGLDYEPGALLGGEIDPSPFQHGAFATCYLSPRDYHRVHMPCSGTLRTMSYVPGRLFSVAPHTVATIERLFTRNERIACLFDTALGAVAVVMVGAINVAAMETVWSGVVTPPRRRGARHWQYAEAPVTLAAGEELGRFNMGSTVIVLTQSGVEWSPHLSSGSPVRLGEPLGRMIRTPQS